MCCAYSGMSDCQSSAPSVCAARVTGRGNLLPEQDRREVCAPVGDLSVEQRRKCKAVGVEPAGLASDGDSFHEEIRRPEEVGPEQLAVAHPLESELGLQRDELIGIAAEDVLLLPSLHSSVLDVQLLPERSVAVGSDAMDIAFSLHVTSPLMIRPALREWRRSPGWPSAG